MAKTTTKIPSNWGPVDIELLRCDQCQTLVQIPHAEGWLQVFRLGDLVMFNSLPMETHFCSSGHLAKYIEENT